MAIEANPTGMAPTIQPVQRPQSTGSTESVNRRGDGGASSPFSPQTKPTVWKLSDKQQKMSVEYASKAAEIMVKRSFSSALALKV